MKHNLSESCLRSLTVDEIVRRLNKMQLTEAGIKRIMARAKNGMIVISAHRSAIASGNPDNDLQAEYEEWCDKEHFNRNSAVCKQSWLNGRNKLASESLRLAIKESPFMYSSIYDCHKDSPIYGSIYDYLMEADYLCRHLLCIRLEGVVQPPSPSFSLTSCITTLSSYARSISRTASTYSLQIKLHFTLTETGTR